MFIAYFNKRIQKFLLTAKLSINTSVLAELFYLLFFFVCNSTNVVMNYTEIEAKVREATNDEAWGPTGQLMQELAHSTFTYEHFPEVMSMLWKRMLQDNKQHWRRTYKVFYLFFNPPAVGLHIFFL